MFVDSPLVRCLPPACKEVFDEVPSDKDHDHHRNCRRKVVFDIRIRTKYVDVHPDRMSGQLGEQHVSGATNPKKLLMKVKGRKMNVIQDKRHMLVLSCKEWLMHNLGSVLLLQGNG